MILERFNAVVFVGDETVQSLYMAFNILLREDLALGGLQDWQMTGGEHSHCKCGNQLSNPECTEYMITSIEDARQKDGGGSDYFCRRKSRCDFKSSNPWTLSTSSQ